MSAKITTTSTRTITVPLADFLRMLTSDICNVELPRGTDEGFHHMRANPDAYICINGSKMITVKVQRKTDLLNWEADLLHGKPGEPEMRESYRFPGAMSPQPNLDLTRTNPDRVSGK